MNALAPVGSAVYQSGFEKNVVVSESSVTTAGMLKFAADEAKALISEAAEDLEES